MLNQQRNQRNQRKEKQQEREKLYPRKQEETEGETLKCNKCGKEFLSKQALTKHRAFTQVGCIGAWHVCKRCFQCFDHLSELRRHQSTIKLCDDLSSASASASASASLPETINKLKLRKAVVDAGSLEGYFTHVIDRANETEIHNTLEACTLDDLSLFCNVVENNNALNVLSEMAVFANRLDVSPEKVAKIKAFILKSTTL